VLGYVCSDQELRRHRSSGGQVLLGERQPGVAVPHPHPARPQRGRGRRRGGRRERAATGPDGGGTGRRGLGLRCAGSHLGHDEPVRARPSSSRRPGDHGLLLAGTEVTGAAHTRTAARAQQERRGWRSSWRWTACAMVRGFRGRRRGRVWPARPTDPETGDPSLRPYYAGKDGPDARRTARDTEPPEPQELRS